MDQACKKALAGSIHPTFHDEPSAPIKLQVITIDHQLHGLLREEGDKAPGQ